jgi:hypothetical protein
MYWTLGVREVDHGVVCLEQVHLLNARDIGHANALEGRLELLVVHARGLVDGLMLPSHSPLAASPNLGGHCLEFCELLCVHRDYNDLARQQPKICHARDSTKNQSEPLSLPQGG